ncbi:MAG: hypothetical protein ACK5Z5_07290 [Neisseriaceae bacterium]
MLKIGHVEQALTIFEEMQTNNTKISQQLYGAMIHALIKNNQAVKALNIMENQLKVNIPIDEIEYTEIIDSLIKINEANTAQDFLKLMLNDKYLPSIKLCAAAIQGFLRNNLIHEALELFNSILRQDYRPNTILYTALIDKFIDKQQLDIALNIINLGIENNIFYKNLGFSIKDKTLTLKRNSIFIDNNSSYNLSAQLCTAILNTIIKMFQPDIINVVIDSYRDNYFRERIHYSAESNEYHIKALTKNQITLEKSISFSVREQIELLLLTNPNEAIKWLESRSSNFDQNDRLQALWSELTREAANELIARFQLIPVEVLSYLHTELNNKDYMDSDSEILSKIDRMDNIFVGIDQIRLFILTVKKINNNIDICAKFCAQWIQVCIKNRMLGKAVFIYNAMIHYSLPRSALIYSKLIYALVDIDFADSTIIVNLMVGFLCSMSNDNFPPSPALCNNVMKRCLELNQFDKALEVLNWANERSPQSLDQRSLISYDKTIHGLIKNNNFETAYMLFNDIKKYLDYKKDFRLLSLYKAIIHGLLKHTNKVIEAYQIFKEIEKHLSQTDLYDLATYKDLIHALLNSRYTDNAYMLFKKIQNHLDITNTRDIVLYDNMIRKLLDIKDVDNAFALFQEIESFLPRDEFTKDLYHRVTKSL